MSRIRGGIAVPVENWLIRYIRYRIFTFVWGEMRYIRHEYWQQQVYGYIESYYFAAPEHDSIGRCPYRY